MFEKLKEYILSNDKDNFTKLLNKQELSMLMETDEKYGGTLIHWAAFYDKIDILAAIEKFKIKKKPKITQKNKSIEPFFIQCQDGMTALHWAAAENSTHAVEYLMENFSQLISIKDKESSTPLHLSAHNCHSETTKLLCEHDERTRDEGDVASWLVNQEDENGNTPFNLTTDAEIKLLLKASNLTEKPIASLLWERLSTSRRYLTSSPINSSELEDSEKYCRSKNTLL